MSGGINLQNIKCEITESISAGYPPSFGLHIVSAGEEYSFPDLCTDRIKLERLAEALKEFPGEEILLELFDDFLYS